MFFKKKPRGRQTRREQISANNAWQRFYASAADKAPVVQVPLPPKREKVVRPVDGKPALPLEREILSAVLKALRSDPRVGFVWRQTSGTFQDGNRFISTGPSGMPDLLGVLKGGKFFAIEVKRPGREPSPLQHERIALFKTYGAVAGYCWSVESALSLLP